MLSTLLLPKSEAAVFVARMSSCPVNHGGKHQAHESENSTIGQKRSKNPECPVDHKNVGTAGASETSISMFSRLATNEEARKGENPKGGCPIDHSKSKEQTKVYDVYGQQIDSRNMMPAVPNDLPAPGQKMRLSTDREKSAIPKSGTAETWVYPSPQMFYNSLKRKGKAEGVKEEDMIHVVAAHNTVNEKTWDEIKRWESKFHCDCDDLKLKKFMARPHDLSPSAYFRTWFRGYSKPFDRHDWTVDRCGEDVRYVIDYYDDPVNVVNLHVRPAVDSLGAVWDRARQRMEHTMAGARSIFAPVPKPAASATVENPAIKGKQSRTSIVTGNRIDQAEFDHLRQLSAPRILETTQKVRLKCSAAVDALMKCKEVGNCEEARIGWEYCVSQEMCPSQARDFMHSLEDGGKDGETNAAYVAMIGCMERFSIVSRRVLAEAASLQRSGPEYPIELASAREGVEGRK